MKLSLVEELGGPDPVYERVRDQILFGMSTRGYGRSFGPLPRGLRGGGAAKSTASRHVVEQTKARLDGLWQRRLEGIELAAFMIDGLPLAESTVVVAIDPTPQGASTPWGCDSGRRRTPQLWGWIGLQSLGL